jgi:hypothetical protein
VASVAIPNDENYKDYGTQAASDDRDDDIRIIKFLLLTDA